MCHRTQNMSFKDEIDVRVRTIECPINVDDVIIQNLFPVLDPGADWLKDIMCVCVCV